MFSGIYMFPLDVLHPISRKPLWKIGRSRNIVKRINDESKEQTCISSPHLSPRTMCIITKNEIAIETHIFQVFSKMRVTKKEIFQGISFQQILETTQQHFKQDIIKTIRFIDLEKNIIDDIKQQTYTNAYIIKGLNEPCKDYGKTVNRDGEMSRVNQLIQRNLTIGDIVFFKNDRMFIKLSPPIYFQREVKSIIKLHKYNITHFKYDLQQGYIRHDNNSKHLFSRVLQELNYSNNYWVKPKLQKP